jgi:hypothetical protein
MVCFDAQNASAFPETSGVKSDEEGQAAQSTQTACANGTRNRELSMYMRNRRASLVQAAAVALAVFIIIAQVLNGWHLSVKSGHAELIALDYGAFYCAGATANARGNPYRTIPYDACGEKQRVLPKRFLAHRLPAPIPGYDIALFKALAKFPFQISAWLWLAFSAAAAFGAVLALGSITGLPAVVIALVLATTLRESLQLGQLTPILLAALVGTGYALAKGRYNLAGVATIIAMVEPHVGLPVMAAMFVWVPRCRITLLTGAAFLCVVSIATLGFDANLDYLRIVLPAHALAEVPTNAQYSLTWLLYVLGVGERVAIRLAEIQYAITVVAGIILGRLLAVRFQSQTFIPFVAAAFSVIGGPYIHITQISSIATLPVFVIAGRRNDILAWISLALLSMNWGNMIWLSNAWSPARLECAIVVGVLAAYASRRNKLSVRSMAAVGAFSLYLITTATILDVSRSPLRSFDSQAQYLRENAAASGFSTLEWGLYQRTLRTNASRQALAAKVPTWLGMTVLVVCVARILRKQPQVRALEYRMPEIVGSTS